MSKKFTKYNSLPEATKYVEKELEEFRDSINKNRTYKPEPTHDDMQKEMQAFAKMLRADPKRVKEFFIRAGIIDVGGNLTEPYR